MRLFVAESAGICAIYLLKIATSSKCSWLRRWLVACLVCGMGKKKAKQHILATKVHPESVCTLSISVLLRSRP